MDAARVIGEALSEPRMVSGIVIGEALNVSQKIIIGHCALMGRAVNNWYLYVMCRPHTTSGAAWQSVTTTFPNTKVKVEHNDVEVTLPPLEEAYEMAVFGRPGKKDMKRMQLALYGGTPKAGINWNIKVELYDDISTVTQQVREKHLKLGNKLLTARAGLFLANSDDHIKIELSGLDAAFQIKGNAIKEISSKEAWNPPEDALDCPTLVYEIAHVDELKSTFFGKISVSHVGDHAEADIIADFEKDADIIEMETSRKDYKDYKVTIKAPDTISRKTMKENSAVSQNCIKIPGKLGVKIPRVFFILAVILMVSVSQCNAQGDYHKPGDKKLAAVCPLGHTFRSEDKIERVFNTKKEDVGYEQTKDEVTYVFFGELWSCKAKTERIVIVTCKNEEHAQKIDEKGWHAFLVAIVAIETCNSMLVVFLFLGDSSFTGFSTGETMELSNGHHWVKEKKRFSHKKSRFKASYILLLMICVFGNPSYDGRPKGIISTGKESREKLIVIIRATAVTVKESGEKLNADQTKTETMVLLGQQLSYDEQGGDLKHMTGSTNVNVFGYTPLDRIGESTHAYSFEGVNVESNVCSEKHCRSKDRTKVISHLKPPSKRQSFKGGSSRIDLDAQNRNPSTPADSKESRWNLKAGLKVLAGETKEPDEFFYLR